MQQADYEVVVAGGGPAGARTAELLAHGGLSVLLLEGEGPDVDNLCSGLLNREGQQALGERLPAQVRREPFEPQLEFHDADNRLRLRYSPGYWNMDRPAFDAWLRERAQLAGAEVRYHTRASRISGGSHPAVETGDGTLRARLVIDATGWRALGRRQLGGTPPLVPPPHVHAFQGVIESDMPPGSMWAVFHTETTPYYGWVVPKGEGRFLLGAGFPKGARHTRRADSEVSDSDPWRKLDYYASHIRALGYSLRFTEASPQGCPITTIDSVCQLWWGCQGVLPVGEAAGLVSPSSGDGIHFCLEHAAAAATAVLDSRHDLSATSAMTAAIRRHLRTALGELRFNCHKARVAARPGLRGLAARALPLYLRRPVERVPFSATARD